jgi:hypothetical protein
MAMTLTQTKFLRIRFFVEDLATFIFAPHWQADSFSEGLIDETTSGYRAGWQQIAASVVGGAR